ncbi:MAG TPA: carboxypeptidase regulatory-like domain-containing protein, partial [Abditibacteriaceae bacterium]
LTLTLKVRVSEVASGALANIAHLFFVDPTGAPQDIASNPAVVQLPQQAPAINFYTDESYANIAGSSLVGRSLFVQARVGQCNSDSTQIDRTFIAITSRLTGDVETFEAVETGPNTGIFRLSAPVVTRAATPSVTRGDDVIETRSGDVLTAGIRCSENDPETLVSTTIRLLDPSGIVFDTRTNTPIAGATVTLINVATGQPAQVFDVDGVTPAPGTVITGPDGTFTFPLVLPGQYRIVVVPPSTPVVYTVPLGPIPASQLPPGRVVVPGSFGLPFEVNAATGDVRFDVPLLPPPPTGLFAQKVASRRIVELTDVLDYQVQIRNTRDTALTGATLSDVLPTGFTYVQGSARLNGAALQNPSGGAGPSLTFNLGDIAASSTVVVAYRVRIGPGSRVGDNFNRAIASGTDNGLTVTSNTASALVRVQTGVFTDKGIIIGKVFVDRNRNSEQDKDEPGIPGVRVFVEDGTFAVTDSEGKYSLYGLSAHTHVIKVDRTTLPANAVLGPISNRHARSGATCFVDLKMGELHKVNFAEVTSSEAILEDVKARRAKAEQGLSEQERNLQTELTRDEELEIGDVRSRPATGLIGNASGGENPDSGTWDVIPRNTNPANNTNPLTPPRPLTEGNSNLPAAPVRVTPSERLEKLLPTLNNELGFIGLQDKDTLPTGQLTVRVKGVQGVTFKLKVNGEDVPASRVGVKSVLPSKQIEAWEYVGVRLKQGENALEVSQVDSFGIERGTQKLTVIAPGVAGKLKVTLPKGTFPADARTLVPITVEIVDDRGALVSARTPVTLETLNGRWQVEDLDDVEPGVQTFIEKGRAEFQLLAPPEPGDSPIEVSSGALASEATVGFVPELRPLIMGGVVEGKLSLGSLGRRGGVSDVFEDELRRLSGGDSALLGGRSAFFLKGRVGKDKLLTLRYESQRNNDDRLFRDIQPDRFYPIYGDSSIKGFDAQSNSRLYA